MKKLSTAFMVLGGLVFAGALICGIVFAADAEDAGFWVFLAWAVGGGIFGMFSLAYSYFLDVAADIKAHIATADIKARFGATETAAAPATRNNPIPTAPQAYESAPKTPAQAVSTQPHAAEPVKPVAPVAGDGYIVCPNCNQRQRSNRTICYNCGAAFSAPDTKQ